MKTHKYKYTNKNSQIQIHKNNYTNTRAKIRGHRWLAVSWKLRLSASPFGYDEESDHSNKAVRKTPEIESGHKVSEEVK